MKRTTALGLAFLAFLAAAPAAAATLGTVEVSARYRCTGGDDMPGLDLRAEDTATGIVVTLERIDGPTKVCKTRVLKAGEVFRCLMNQDPGREFYRATVAVAGTAKPYEVAFSSAVSRPFDISVRGEDVDLEAGRIALSVKGEAKKVVLTFWGEDGAMLLQQEARMDLPSGRPSALTFPRPAVRVAKVEIAAYEEEGFKKAVDFSPIVVEVPHDEANFEFGKSDILPAEEPKLQRALDETHRILDSLGKVVRLRLYVAGYTDTVASREYNQGLSEARAAATANWLMKHGLRIPVCSQGFGEDVLSVKTPDETPEPKNRRSLYVLAAQGPDGPAFPRGNWVCH
jgi:outer membrane protein OmpA-like peptidoglycan-associated protein